MINVHQAAEGFYFVAVGYVVVVLIYLLDCQLLAHHPDYLGIGHVELGYLHDFGGHRSRKEHCLALLRYIGKYRFYVVAKAHREHFIGFVKNGDLHLVQPERAAAHVIHYPARSADHYLNAGMQLPYLTINVLTAVDRCRTYPFDVTGQLAYFLTRLHRKLPCGTQNQHLYAPVSVGNQSLDGRNGKGSRFSRAGLRLTYYVPAAHEQRNCFGLYRSGFFVAYVVNCLHNRRGKP